MKDEHAPWLIVATGLFMVILIVSAPGGHPKPATDGHLKTGHHS